MRALLALLLCALSVFFAAPASASIPSKLEYRMYTNSCPGGTLWSDWAPFPDGVANYAGIATCRTSPTDTLSTSVVSCDAASVKCTFNITDTTTSGSSSSRTVTYGPDETRTACPAYSTASGSACVCSTGYKESGKACVVDKPVDSVCGEMAGKPLGLPVTADYGSKSPSALGRMIGNSSTTCFPGGCSVSGTVSGCWSAKGVAGCNLTDAKFTGDKCDDKAPPGGCPSGSSPSQYAAGVCIPDENKCPAGSSPSKYASGVCIPDENPCPAGQAPSKYAAGVCVPKDDPNADGNGVSGNNSK